MYIMCPCINLPTLNDVWFIYTIDCFGNYYIYIFLFFASMISYCEVIESENISNDYEFVDT